MRITKQQLRRMVIQEMKKVRRQKRLQEGTAARPIKITPRLLNRIIKEEYAAFQKKQRIVEARRRRIAESRRRRSRRNFY
tara:strand:+ start:230 stop:469 length:240 start_codon:yes stop_codon:yes gene_type:complete